MLFTNHSADSACSNTDNDSNDVQIPWLIDAQGLMKNRNSAREVEMFSKKYSAPAFPHINWQLVLCLPSWQFQVHGGVNSETTEQFLQVYVHEFHINFYTGNGHGGFMLHLGKSWCVDGKLGALMGSVEELDGDVRCYATVQVNCRLLLIENGVRIKTYNGKSLPPTLFNPSKTNSRRVRLFCYPGLNSSVENKPLVIVQFTVTSGPNLSCHWVVQPENLSSLLTSGEMADFKIQVGDVVFPVHKVLLMAQSTVFRTMFQINLAEKESRCLTISDFPADAVQTMLEYIYTGWRPDFSDAKETADLLRLADKYDLVELKENCQMILIECINDQNFFELVAVADDVHSLEDLKACCFSYFPMHEASLITFPEWKDFRKQRPNLALDLLELHIVPKKSDETLA